MSSSCNVQTRSVRPENPPPALLATRCSITADGTMSAALTPYYCVTTLKARAKYSPRPGRCDACKAGSCIRDKTTTSSVCHEGCTTNAQILANDRSGVTVAVPVRVQHIVGHAAFGCKLSRGICCKAEAVDAVPSLGVPESVYMCVCVYVCMANRQSGVYALS